MNLEGGIARIINECGQLSPNILKTTKLFHKQPQKDVTIVPSDKKKRLIALETIHYNNIYGKQIND